LREIEERADRFGIAPESDDNSEVIRQAIFKTRSGSPYRAPFLVRNQDVYILHVRAPGRDNVGAEDLRLPE
jgi:hypothetical protein